MGEAQGTLFEPEFNRSIKVQTSEQRITSHAGAVLLREADHQLGLVESLAEQLHDPRHPEKIRCNGHRLGNGFMHAILRQGQVHTAQGIKRFMQQVIGQARQMTRSFDLRLDAGYTVGPVMDELSSENVRFCGRLKNNAVLDRLAEPHLGRPSGRPLSEGYEKVIELGKHQPESWEHAQRLILVVVDKPDSKTGQLALLPRYFFLVTNWPRTLRSGEEVLVHYRRRGTFEDRLGEFNEAIGPHLSSREFVENEVTMLLAMLAFNLTTMLRNEFEAALEGSWNLRRFQQSVLRAGGRVVKHARRV